MNTETLREEWCAEEAAPFKGWDFSHLDGRCEEEPLPWDYKEIVNQYRRPEQKLLDIGTGGGEFLLSLGHPFANTAVTESWEPNIRLCKERLQPLGIRVAPTQEDAPLPFADGAFDLVINRHASYDAAEIRRILKPGGVFVTEQVGGENNRSLSERLLGAFQPQFPGFGLGREAERFRAEGFTILRWEEYFPRLRFFDIGAVVWFAKVIVWEFPGFSVERCFPQLCELERERAERGFVESREHRFLLVAKK